MPGMFMGKTPPTPSKQLYAKPATVTQVLLNAIGFSDGFKAKVMAIESKCGEALFQS